MKSINGLAFQNLQRVAFISPHPDDVELCCGIIIRRLIQSKIKIFHFCVTDGAPSSEILSTIGRLPENYERSNFKSIRRNETIESLKILGVNSAQIRFLDYPDMECHKHIPAIVSDFINILKNVDIVFCCPFEGGHQDHDICRFALAMAADRTNFSGSIFEYASYNNRGYQIFQSELPRSFTIIADTEEREIKRQVAQIFISQEATVKKFTIDLECFRHGETAFNPDYYTGYSMVPYYERLAISSSVILGEIKKYINSDH